MEKIVFLGLEINKISIKDLLFNRAMFLAYALLALAFFGIFEVFHIRLDILVKQQLLMHLV